MTDARADILGRVRQAARRFDASAAPAAAPPGLVRPGPRVAPPADPVAAFTQAALAAAASVAALPRLADVPGEVARFLRERNQSPEAVVAPAIARLLEGAAFRAAGLDVRVGAAVPADRAGIVLARAGLAETGTLMLASGPADPATLNLVPDLAFVVLPRAAVHAGFEAVWPLLGDAVSMPRTVNFVTGPSRTGDVEMVMVLGAHGPRTLHIMIVDDAPAC